MMCEDGMASLITTLVIVGLISLVALSPSESSSRITQILQDRIHHSLAEMRAIEDLTTQDPLAKKSPIQCHKGEGRAGRISLSAAFCRISEGSAPLGYQLKDTLIRYHELIEKNALVCPPYYTVPPQHTPWGTALTEGSLRSFRSCYDKNSLHQLGEIYVEGNIFTERLALSRNAKVYVNGFLESSSLSLEGDAVLVSSGDIFVKLVTRTSLSTPPFTLRVLSGTGTIHFTEVSPQITLEILSKEPYQIPPSTPIQRLIKIPLYNSIALSLQVYR